MFMTETKVKNLSRVSSIPKEATPCKAGFREYKIPGGHILHWIQQIMSLSQCTPSIWQICWGQTFQASPSGKHQRETRRLQAQHWSAFLIPTFLLFDFRKTSLDYCQSKLRYHSDHRFNIQAMKVKPHLERQMFRNETTKKWGKSSK